MGLGLAAALLVLFAVIRRKKLVGRGSHDFTLLNILLCCSTFNYGGVIVLGLEPTDLLCSLRWWLPALGLAAALGSIFAKNFKIVSIFRNETYMVPYVSRVQMFYFIAAAVFFPVFILGVGTIAEVPRVTSAVERDGSIVPACSFYQPVVPLLIANLAIMLIIGCLLSWLLRNVPERYSECKPLIFSLCCVSVVALVCIPLHAYTETAEAVLLLRLTGLLSAATLIMLPPLIPVLLGLRIRGCNGKGKGHARTGGRRGRNEVQRVQRAVAMASAQGQGQGQEQAQAHGNGNGAPGPDGAVTLSSLPPALLLQLKEEEIEVQRRHLDSLAATNARLREEVDRLRSAAGPGASLVTATTTSASPSAAPASLPGSVLPSASSRHPSLPLPGSLPLPLPPSALSIASPVAVSFPAPPPLSGMTRSPPLPTAAPAPAAAAAASLPLLPPPSRVLPPIHRQQQQPPLSLGTSPPLQVSA